MNKKRGFTLIELLVVIAIIALLMSILMPALSKVKKSATAVVCLSRVKQWGVIFSMYTSENDGYFHSREVGTTWGYSRMWPYVYKKMYLDPKMRFCPAAENPTRDTGPLGTWNYTVGSYYPLPDLPMPGEREYEAKTGNIAEGFFTGSYGMGRFVEDMKGGIMGTSPEYWRKADIRGGSNAPVLTDCQYLYFWGGPDDSPPAYNGDYTTPDMHWICIDRHGGFVNVVFLDFSARKVGLKELWTLKFSRTTNTCGPWTVCGFGGNRNECASAWNDVAAWMKNYPVY
jgi:prepilin-type N-terminal cleavage/methylation domain-containing protein/prepilin-type processing-associated H-X9-DG protein